VVSLGDHNSNSPTSHQPRQENALQLCNIAFDIDEERRGAIGFRDESVLALELFNLVNGASVSRRLQWKS
jgi:hypothetical protein